MARSPEPLNLPWPLAATTVPVTGAPARMTFTPWTTTDCASVPVKVSPTLLFLALTVCCMRTTSGVPLATTYFCGGGGGGGASGAGGGAALCAGAAVIAAGGGAGAGGASGAAAGGGADCAVVAGSAAAAGGAGLLLHPPRSSNPVNPIESMPAREYAFCLCARPPVEYPGPKNACVFMILSLNKKFSALPC